MLSAGAAPPRASVVSRWRLMDPGAALRTVADPAFDPEALAVLEEDPGVPASTGAAGEGTAAFRWLSPQSARIDVTSPGSAIVLVRNTFESGWHATIDGAAAPVLRTDFFLQGVPVTGGKHVIVLTYRDPSIGIGLAVSAAALAVLLGTAAALALRRRKAGAARGPAS